MDINDLKIIYTSKIENFFSYYNNVKDYLSFQENVTLSDLSYTFDDITKCLEYALNNGYSFLPTFIYLYCITQEWKTAVSFTATEEKTALELAVDDYVSTYSNITEDFETAYNNYINNNFQIGDLPILNFFIEQRKKQEEEETIQEGVSQLTTLVEQLIFFWNVDLSDTMPSYTAKTGFFPYENGLTDEEKNRIEDVLGIIDEATYVDEEGNELARYDVKRDNEKNNIVYAVYDNYLKQYLVGGDS